jgi:hypothetical protein
MTHTIRPAAPGVQTARDRHANRALAISRRTIAVQRRPWQAVPHVLLRCANHSGRFDGAHTPRRRTVFAAAGQYPGLWQKDLKSQQVEPYIAGYAQFLRLAWNTIIRYPIAGWRHWRLVVVAAHLRQGLRPFSRGSARRRIVQTPRRALNASRAEFGVLNRS